MHLKRRAILTMVLAWRDATELTDPPPRRGHQVAPLQAVALLLIEILARATPGLAQEEKAPSTDVHEHVAATAPLLTPTKEASGTAWLPPATPMYGVHQPWRGWDLRVAAGSCSSRHSPNLAIGTGPGAPTVDKSQLSTGACSWHDGTSAVDASVSGRCSAQSRGRSPVAVLSVKAMRNGRAANSRRMSGFALFLLTIKRGPEHRAE